jgi:hypothetical protein
MDKKPQKTESDPDDLLVSACKLWDVGNDRAAFKGILSAAMAGSKHALHNVGYCYDIGLGVKKDMSKALYWYKRAWSATKDTGTSCNIAQLYAEHGNYRRATYWWQRAVDLGDGDAAYDYARFLIGRHHVDRMRIANLLKRAVRSKHVTEDSREAAKDLLRSL